MNEIVVILAGCLLGAGATQIASRRLRIAAVVLGAVVLGTAWSRLVGEHELLALWDSAQALAGALAAIALLGARRRPVAHRGTE